MIRDQGDTVCGFSVERNLRQVPPLVRIEGNRQRFPFFIPGIAMPFVVYVLLSEKDQRFYIGQTGDLQKRLERHRKGYVKSTRNRRPLILLYQQTFSSRSEAMRQEKYFKSGAGHRQLKKILQKELADASRNPVGRGDTGSG